MQFHERLKVALGGEVPAELQANFEKLENGQTDRIFIPYGFGRWEELNFGSFLHEEGIGFYDGGFGVEVFDDSSNN